MKLKHLENNLQDFKVFSNPKIQLEQYPTTPHLAACLIFTAHNTFDDIQDKTIVDLGVGCGILTGATCMMGSGFNICVDIDEDALNVCRTNFNDFEIGADLIHSNVKDIKNLKADTVIMNPPFGTKNPGIDYLFLKKAAEISNHAIYSMHKSSTRTFIEKKSKELNLESQVLAQLQFDIPAMYKCHKKDNVVVQVDLWRFNKK